MKVFVCTGAIGHDSSTTNFVVEEFIKGLIKHGNEDVTVFYANLLNYHIEFCDGSIQPFITGKTQSSDDMVFLEKEMLSSDLIVIASPVYANTVSGSIKTFIDRIAHWTHLFRLCGKYGALFSISSNSGAEDTLNYLNDIMGTMGLSIVCKEGFITNTYTKEAIKNILDVQSALVIKKLNQELWNSATIKNIILKNTKNCIVMVKAMQMNWTIGKVIKCLRLRVYLN